MVKPGASWGEWTNLSVRVVPELENAVISFFPSTGSQSFFLKSEYSLENEEELKQQFAQHKEMFSIYMF